MNRTQRVVLVVYCLLLAYCCVWIPWHVKHPGRYGDEFIRLGYGWLWAGPYRKPPSVVYYDPPKGSGEWAMASEEDISTRFPDDPIATPDFALIGLRFAAATLIGAALSLVGGIARIRAKV